MGLVLKHVERTKTGGYQYRRRVPKEVASVITKREFKRKLGDSEKEALKAWPQYHAEVEREIAVAQKRLASAAAARMPGASEREAYVEALRHRADLIAAGVGDDELALIGETLMDRFPQDEWAPIGVPPVEAHTINLLRLGPERYKAPAPTLEDARKLYVAEKLGEEEKADSRTTGRIGRVVRNVTEALGRDPLLNSLTREDARKVNASRFGAIGDPAGTSGGVVRRRLLAWTTAIPLILAPPSERQEALRADRGGLRGADGRDQHYGLPAKDMARRRAVGSRIRRACSISC